MGCHFQLQGIFWHRECIPLSWVSCIFRQILYHPCHLLIITLLSFRPSLSPELLTYFQLLLYVHSYCYRDNSVPMSQNRTHHLPALSPPFLYACLIFLPPTNILSQVISLLSPYPVSHQFLLSYLLSINTFKSIFSLFLLPLFEFIPLLLVTCYAKKIAKSNITQFLL